MHSLETIERARGAGVTLKAVSDRCGVPYAHVWRIAAGYACKDTASVERVAEAARSLAEDPDLVLRNKVVVDLRGYLNGQGDPLQQAEIGRRIGVSRQVIHHWLIGMTRPTIEKARALDRLLRELRE